MRQCFNCVHWQKGFINPYEGECKWKMESTDSQYTCREHVFLHELTASQAGNGDLEGHI